MVIDRRKRTDLKCSHHKVYPAKLLQKKKKNKRGYKENSDWKFLQCDCITVNSNIKKKQYWRLTFFTAADTDKVAYRLALKVSKCPL